MRALLLSAFIAFGFCLALFFADSAVEKWQAPERIRAETDSQVRIMETEGRMQIQQSILNQLSAYQVFMVFAVLSLFCFCCFLSIRLMSEIHRTDSYKAEMLRMENYIRIHRLPNYEYQIERR